MTRFHDTDAAQLEGAALVVDRIAPETRADWDTRSAAGQRLGLARPAVALADWNDGRGSAVTAADVAAQISGHVYGRTVDKVVARNVVVKSVRYVSAVPFLRRLIVMMSDHKHALVVKVEVPRKWWKP